MSNEKMIYLLQRQDDERKELAAGAYLHWQPVKAQEEQLLAPYDGDYDKAPDHTKQQISIAREEYFSEWGSEGRLTALMSERHKGERERLARQIFKIETIITRNKNDKDHGR